ncbi:unnamed protein product [Calypogeia fissa]
MGDQSSDSEVEEERTGEPIPSGSDESDSDGDAEEGLREQVADVPFEELQKARSNGGAPLFARNKPKILAKRANKNRPMEVTSRKPVPRFREVIQAPKRVIRDPRFEAGCGQFEESKFKSAYSFLYNEQLPAERRELQKVLKKRKADDDAEAKLTWIEKQLKEEEERRKQVTKTAQIKAKQQQAFKQGKKPFYLKKSEIRKEELVEKFKELKSSGKLEKYMEKRRRKNASKDHRYVPYRRNVD